MYVHTMKLCVIVMVSNGFANSVEYAVCVLIIIVS
jgi:hypothetical protein